MKYILMIVIFFVSVFTAFSQDLAVTVEINNIVVGKGTVYAAVYNSADAYKKQKVFMTETVDSVSATVKLSLLLPAGEYVVSVYQDTNNNRKLDTNLIGMPKEPVGISNYSGKGIPGGFDKLKATIRNGDTVLTVNMTQL